jgi:hypothetical protein
MPQAVEVDPSQVHSIEVSPDQVSAPPSTWDKVKNAVGDFAAGVGQELNPVKMFTGARDLAAGVVYHPIDTAKAIGAAQGAVLDKAIAAYQAGDYATAARHALGYAIPLAGPAIDEMGDEAAEGHVAHALGRAAGFGVAGALPGSEAGDAVVTGAKRLTLRLRTPANPNPVQAAAVDFGQANDIPVSAATASGNKFVSGAQAIVDHSPIGSVVAQTAKHAEDAAFTRVGGELASQVHPTPIVPTQAGRAAADELDTGIRKFSKEAGGHYDNIREIEADPANRETVIQGYRTEEVPGQDPRRIPITEEISLPADTQAAKDALKPIYERMVRQMPVTQERASAGLKAMRNVMDGPRFVPASQLEEDLATMKGISRGSGDEMPEFRDLSQRLAGDAIEEVDKAVRAALSRAKRSDVKGFTSAEGHQGVTDGELPLGAIADKEAPPAPKYEAPTDPDAANTQIPVPGSEKSYKARYEVRELADVQPSHIGQTFEPNPKYKLQNERTYTDSADREKVAVNSTPEAFDPSRHITDNPDATNGPVIIDSEGNALGGNGRGMMLQRVYASKEGSAAANYRDMLMKKADQFGVDRRQIAGMKEPVLVRVIDDSQFAEPGMSKQAAITDFNKVPTAALKNSERAISDARGVSGSTLDFVARGLDDAGPDATLAQVLQDHGSEVLDRLVKDGVVSPQARAEFATGDKLTSLGKERISNLMLGRFFSDAGAMEGLAPSMRAKLERIAPHLGRVEGEPAWNLSPHMRQAIDLIEEGRAHGVSDLDELREQYTDLFGHNQKYSDEAAVLANRLQKSNPNELTDAVRQYVEHAKYAREYQGPGLSNEFPQPHTPTEGFNDAFKSMVSERAAEPPAPEAPRWNPRAADTTPEPVNAPPPPKPVIPSRPAGAEAMQSLEAGRRATFEKYQVKKVKDALPKGGDEGQQVFAQAIWSKDAGIEQLKRLAEKAPQSIPKIGRAVLEDLFSTATAEGGFGKAQTLYSKWQNLGPETKQILFKAENPKMIEDLNNFFHLAKMAAERANPSGTATTAAAITSLGYAFTHPATGIPMIIAGGALSKLMHSPAAVAALSKGFTVSLGRAVQAQMVLGQIAKLSEGAARPAADVMREAEARAQQSAPSATAAAR